MKPSLIVSCLILAVVGCGGAFLLGQHFGKTAAAGGDAGAETAAAERPTALASSTQIVAQGRLEPQGGIIAVAALPGERIEQLPVSVGDVVKQDQELAVMAGSALRKVQWELAKLQVAEARKNLEFQKQTAQLQADAASVASEQARVARDEVKAKASQLELLKSQVELADRELAKLIRLAEDPRTRDVVTPREVNEKSLVTRKLRSDWELAKEQHRLALEANDLAADAAQKKQDLARLALAQVMATDPISPLEAAEQVAKLQYEMTRVLAPQAGTILAILTRAGEHVSHAPILQMGDTSKMVCLAEVYESRLQEVQLDARVEIRSPALGEALRGTVRQIGQLVGTPELPNPNPLARGDRRTGVVRIELDPEDSARAAHYVNLQVNVIIELSGQEGSSGQARQTTDRPARRWVSAAVRR